MAIGAASALAALAAQTAIARGAGSPSLTGVSTILSTRTGTAWGVALVAWLAVAAALTGGGRRTDHPRVLMALGLPLAVLTLVPAATGHAGRGGVLLLANVVHVSAVSAWLGGLVALLLVARVAPPSPRRAWRRRSGCSCS